VVAAVGGEGDHPCLPQEPGSLRPEPGSLRQEPSHGGGGGRFRQLSGSWGGGRLSGGTSQQERQGQLEAGAGGKREADHERDRR